MARYIDAEKAVARFEACLWGKDYDGVLAKSCIDDAPTADVVEVVRCKDCKFYNFQHHYCEGIGNWFGREDDWSDNGFCYKGERREE